MSRFELSISPDYVPNWGLVEATRELFQNALDQETSSPSNKMDYNWSIEDGTFWISSKESVLEKSSLLLGCSSKADDPTTIGKFGEGYKLALLVLSRLGYRVKIYNYAAKEIWVPRIIKSKRYNSDLLVIDVSKHRFTSEPDSNLTFIISGVTPDDACTIREHTLFMQTEGYKYKTPKGDILLDEQYAGMLFVNGLYICTAKPEVITKGYNFKPEVISLDRDRTLVDSFSLQWETSQAWGSITDATCKEMILSDAPDVEFIKTFMYSQHNQLSEDTFASFQCKYGLNTIPVSTQVELDNIKKNYPSLKPIIVSSGLTGVISRGSSYAFLMSSAKSNVKYKTVKQRIEDLMEEHAHDLPSDFADELTLTLKDLHE